MKQGWGSTTKPEEKGLFSIPILSSKLSAEHSQTDSIVIDQNRFRYYRKTKD